MQRLVDKLAKSVRASTPVPLEPSWKALLQRRFSEDFAKEPTGSVDSMEKDVAPAGLERAWVSALRRASQAWICIWESLGRDCGLCSVYDVQGEPAVRTIDFLAHLDLAGLLLKWVKETSCYCSCLGLQQEKTNATSLTKIRDGATALGLEQPSPGCLGWGWVGNRCKWIMAPRRSMGTSFRMHVFAAAQNVLYMKRGMPCMRQSDLASCLHDHHDALTVPHPGSSETLLEEIEGVLEDLVAEVYGGKLFRPTEVFPSMNAAYGHPRKKGGAWGAIIGDCIAAGLEESSPTTYLEPSLLLGMRELGPAMVREQRSDPVCESILQRVSAFIDRSARCDPTPSRGPRRIRARPAPVAEPCKARIVTSGEVYPYQRGFCLQKFLHGVLRRHRLFEYIGKPVSHGEWPFDKGCPFTGELAGVLKAGQYYNSGDYKNASDNLNPRLSRAAWTAISRVVRLDMDGAAPVPLYETSWYWVGLQALTEHDLDYDKAYPNAPQLAERQAWGQLMGSPMSFPILNLINAAATIASLGWYVPRRDRPLHPTGYRNPTVMEVADTIGLRTNGDDIVFITDDSGYRAWERYVCAAGLEPSLGKNYTSRDFAIINSEMRVRKRAPLQVTVTDPEGTERALERPFVWEPVGFLNLPLLMGLDAKGTYAGQSILNRTCWWQIGSLIRTLCAWVPDDVSRIREARAEDYYAEVLGRVPPGVNYYTPESLGGLGLPSTPDQRANIPANNRQRSAWLACLDERTRAAQLTPPAPRRPDWISCLTKKARKAIASRTYLASYPDDSFERRLHLLDRAPVDLLVHQLKYLDRHRDWLCQVWQVMFVRGSPGTDKAWAFKSVDVKPEDEESILGSDLFFPTDVLMGVCPDPTSATGAELERVALEKAMSTRIIKQLCDRDKVPASRGRIAPMGVTTLMEWSSQNVLLEEELMSGVDLTAVRLWEPPGYQAPCTQGELSLSPVLEPLPTWEWEL